MMTSPLYHRAPSLTVPFPVPPPLSVSLLVPLLLPLPVPLIVRRPMVSTEFSAGGLQDSAGGCVRRCPVVSTEFSAFRPRDWAGGTVPEWESRCPVKRAEYDDAGIPRLYSDFTIDAILGLTKHDQTNEDDNDDLEQSTSSVMRDTYETSFPGAVNISLCSIT